MKSKEMTPMMQQYLETKAQYKDCILFYRLGDFYEMFFDDAITVSRELELTLTGKECGLEERAPMCGVPYHAVDTYLNRLVAKGYKVAIGEQMEDPKLAKGLVKREVIRIVTPGTNIERHWHWMKQKTTILCAIVYTADSYRGFYCRYQYRRLSGHGSGFRAEAVSTRSPSLHPQRSSAINHFW